MTEVDHRQLAVNLFNQTWEYLDKQRTADEDYQMVLIAHASCYHWSQCGTELEQARGEWLISRVHSVLEQGSIALWHAQRSLDLCIKNGFGGFDLAFGYEAVARAYACLGVRNEMNKAMNEAKAAAENILDEGDKKYTFREIDTIVVD
jgi:hypothetical protein